MRTNMPVVVLRHQLPYALEIYLRSLQLSPVLQRLRQQVLPAKWHRLLASAVHRSPSVHVVFEHLTNLHNAAACCRTADALGVQHVHLITREHTHSSLCADVLQGAHGDQGALRAQRALLALQQHSPTRRVSRASDALVGFESASGAARWLTFYQHSSTEACMLQLRERFGVQQVFASDLSPNSVAIADLSLAHAHPSTNSCDEEQQPLQLDALPPSIALVFGNEHNGISDTVRSHATQCFHLPMVGMVESLNLSVAFGMTLYHMELVGILRAHLVEPPCATSGTPIPATPATPAQQQQQQYGYSEQYTSWLNELLEDWVARSIPHGERVRQQLRANLPP